MNIAEFNYIEAVLWFIIAVALAVNALLKGKSDSDFKITMIASVAFVAFGISDIIEAQTGAWWRPISLFVLKAVCVATFGLCFFKYKKIRNGKNFG